MIGRQAQEQTPAFDGDDRKRAPFPERERAFDGQSATRATGRGATAQQPCEPAKQTEDEQQRDRCAPHGRHEIRTSDLLVGDRDEKRGHAASTPAGPARPDHD